MSLQDPAYAQADLAPDSVAIGRVVGGFHSALAAGDSNAALSLMAPDVIVLEAGGAESRAEYRSHHLAADIAFARAVPSRPGLPPSPKARARSRGARSEPRGRS
jgi:predicted trehalose synthase